MIVQWAQCGRFRQLLTLTAGLFAVAASFWLPGVVHAAADPVLTLTPDHGSCDTEVALRGTGFPPGQELGIVARRTRPDSDLAIPAVTSTVAADGTFVVSVRMRNVTPGCPGGRAPDAGTEITFYVETREIGGRSTVLARAVFTASSPSPPGLPSTGGSGAQAPAPRPGGLLVGGALLVGTGGVGLGGARLRRRVR